MPSNGGFTRLTNLPGQSRGSATPGPGTSSSMVGQFQNQRLPGLSTGTNRGNGGTAPADSPSQQLLSMRRPETGVQLSAKRTSDAVRATNSRLMQLSQQQGQKRRARQQAEQAAKAQQGGYQSSGQQQGRGATGGVSYNGSGGGGPAVSRIQGILGRFPGLRITETLGDRGYDQSHGVPRSPNSYHYDSRNPAVDIAGSPAQLHQLYKQLVAMGGWRQILWQVPGHYDHIHVAAEGGIVGADGPLGTKKIPFGQGETFDFGEDTEPAMLKPGEVVVTKEAADAIGPENLVAANKEMSGALEEPSMEEEPALEGPPPATPTGYMAPGADLSGLASMAYGKLGPQYRGVVEGKNVPGVRTALRNLRPGDLIAWKDGSHIAVYAGNGEVVDRGGSRRPLWAPESAVYGIALRLPGE